MDPQVFKQLHAGGLISDDSLQRVEALEKSRLFSLHWELKALLYLGVVLLSGGLGILVYKNIETIGHRAILIFIALVCAGCFYYCIRKKSPFSVHKVGPPDAFFDYILLLACLSFLTFIGYLQFQYDFFGDKYGLATFIPMLVLFISAYYFDHIGVLSLAITNLAAWAGIAITPTRILKDNAFEDSRLIYTALVLAATLVLAGVATEKRNIKKHFSFTYTNFGGHLAFIAGLAGLFTLGFYPLWFLALLGIAWYFYQQALKKRSFYFLVITVLYSYIALTYVAIKILSVMGPYGSGPLYLGFMYLILSAIGVVRFLISHNQKMKTHDRL